MFLLHQFFMERNVQKPQFDGLFFNRFQNYRKYHPDNLKY
jgi:hypothetical protein